MGSQGFLLTLILKFIDPTSISYQHVCCERGGMSSFCLQKNGDVLVMFERGEISA